MCIALYLNNIERVLNNKNTFHTLFAIFKIVSFDMYPYFLNRVY
jgi:hypothetical protein